MLITIIKHLEWRDGNENKYKRKTSMKVNEQNVNSGNKIVRKVVKRWNKAHSKHYSLNRTIFVTIEKKRKTKFEHYKKTVVFIKYATEI